jgi:hypothetical protein
MLWCLGTGVNVVRYNQVLTAAIALMLEAFCTSETSVSFYQSTRRNIPKVIYIIAAMRIWNITKMFNCFIWVWNLVSYIEWSTQIEGVKNTVLRGIFGPKRDEVTGGWMRPHEEDLRNFYSITNIIRMFNWRRMRWAGYVARFWQMRNSYRMLAEKPLVKRPSENLGIEGRFTLKSILAKQDRSA